MCGRREEGHSGPDADKITFYHNGLADMNRTAAPGDNIEVVVASNEAQV
jgi:hypothetical protein